MENEADKKTPIKTDIVSYTPDTFELYCTWKSLPSFFKYPPMPRKGKVRPTTEEFLDGLGIDDPITRELAEIKSQRQFAERYNVHPDTLSDWNKTNAVKDSLEEIRRWSRQLSKNVILALYNKALKDGSSFEVSLFFKLIEKWEEKSKIEHDYKGVTEFKIIQQIISHGDTAKGDENRVGTN